MSIKHTLYREDDRDYSIEGVPHSRRVGKDGWSGGWGICADGIESHFPDIDFSWDDDNDNVDGPRELMLIVDHEWISPTCLQVELDGDYKDYGCCSLDIEDHGTVTIFRAFADLLREAGYLREDNVFFIDIQEV